MSGSEVLRRMTCSNRARVGSLLAVDLELLLRVADFSILK